MPTSPGTDAATPQTVEGQLADLICSDQELLDAEFDAIIAAEWPDPPADHPRGDAAGERPVPPMARPAATWIRTPVDRPPHPGVGGWARPRSPPTRG